MARARNQGKVSLAGLARRSRSALMVSTALQAVVVMVLAVPAGAQPAPNARPTGGTVVGGSVTISQTATNTIVDQTTQRGAVNWSTFNVGSNQTVTFEQPNAQAITLNTVTSANPSQIAGRIDANGQVVLVNQSGVMFYKGSQVNTAGLMVSAAGTDTKAFMNGGPIVFNQAGNPNAQIVNNGNITIKDAGLASLVAPSVVNSGTISARLGHVVLAGGTAATLDLYGDKLVSVDVTGAVTQAPGGGEALVTNTGVIRANGGTVRLTAKAVDGVVNNLVSAGGQIVANTVGSKTGKITIDGVGGSITIDGDVSAQGKAAGTKGGQIGLLATDAVIVQSGAKINASGAAGGGTIAVGTTLKRAAGGPSVKNAKTAQGVWVQPGATISANATQNGNGGRITVLSSILTSMEGTISATGGALGGNGGYVEVSGGVVSLTGAVNVGAVNGLAGSLLLDPENLNIVDSTAGQFGTDVDNAFNTNNGTISVTNNNNGVSYLTASSINNQGSGNGAANITLQADGTIDFENALTPITLTKSLTVQAGADILVDRGVSITVTGNNNAISFTAGTAAGNVGSIALGTTGTGGAVQITAPSVTLSAGSTGINLNDAVVMAGSNHVSGSFGNRTTTFVGGPLEIDAVGGGVTQAVAGTILADSITSSNGITGNVILSGTSNAIGTLNAMSISGGNLTLVNAGTNDLFVVGTVSATSVALTEIGNNITIGDGHTATTIEAATNNGTVSILSDALTLNAGTVTGSMFEYAPDSATLLTLGSVAPGTTGQLVSLTGINTTALRLGEANGSVNATGITLISTLDANLTGNARPLDLEASGNIANGTGAALINVSTLSGTVTGGSLSITGSNNTVAAIGPFSATSGSIVVNDTTALAISGVVTAEAVSLSAASGISFNTGGAIQTPGTGTVSLNSSAGAIAENQGTVITGTLTGQANGSFVLAGTTVTGGGTTLSTNQIGTLGTLSGAGVTVTDNASLTVLSGATVNANTGTVSLTSAGGLTVNGVVTGAAATLASITGMTIAGTVTAAAVSLSDGTTLVNNGLITDGGAGTVNLSVTNGGISETSGTLVAGTLSGSAGGAVVLAGTTVSAGNTLATNTIAALGAFSGAGITLTDSAALTVNGVVNGGTGAVNLNSGGVLSVAAATGTVTAASVGLTGTSVSIAGLVQDGQTVGSFVSLTANGGSITETGTLNAVTLGGSATGTITLTNSVVVGTISSLTGAGIVLNDGTAVTVGTFNAGSGAASLTSTGLVTINGAISGTAVALTGTSGILFNTATATVTDGGGGTGSGTVSLITASGSIAEAQGTIIAGTLSGSASSGVTLTGTNKIGDLGGFTTSSGNLSLADANGATGLTVIGSISAANIVLTDAGSGGITIGNGTNGTLAASNTGTVSVQADNFSINAANATITGGTFEFAPNTATDVLSVGTAAVSAGTVQFSGLTGIGATYIRLGQVNGGAASDSAIVINGTAGGLSGAGLLAVELDSKGTVSLTNNATLTIGTLAGTAAAFALPGAATGTSVNIGTIGVSGGTGLTGTSGAVAINDGAVVTIAGTVSGTSVALSGNAITLLSTGSITTGGSATGAVSLTATGGGTIDTSQGGVTAGTLSVSTTGSVTITNAANAFGTLGTVLGTGISINDGVALTIGAVPVNASAGVASIASTGSLTVNGSVTGAGVTLTGTGIAIGGTVNAGGGVASVTSAGSLSISGGVTGASVSLTGSGITIASTGSVSDGELAGDSVSLYATAAAGSILQNGTLDAVTLTGSAGASANLIGNGTGTTTNNVATLAAFSVGSGSFALNSAENINVTGTVAAPSGGVSLAAMLTGGTVAIIGAPSAGAVNAAATIAAGSVGTVSILSDSFTTGGTFGTSPAGTVSAAVFELAPYTTSSLALSGSLSFQGVGAQTLRLGKSGSTITATSISLSAFSDTSGILDLNTTGTVTQTGSLNIGTLAGTAASFLLNSFTNSIGTLGGVGLTATGAGSNAGTIALNNGTTSLTISAPVSAAALGTSAPVINLSAGTIALTSTGSIATGGTAGSVTLAAVGSGTPLVGAITEAGSGGISTTTLTATSVGTIALGGSNTIGTLTGLSGLGITLNDGTALTIASGTAVNGGSTSAISITAQSLTIAGSVSAGTISLTGTNGILFDGTGLVSDGGGGTGSGTVALISSSGSIDETNGTLVAGSLSVSASTGATLWGGATNLAGAGSGNEIGTLTSGSATTGVLTLIDNNGVNGLTVAGAVTAPAIRLSNVGTAALTIGSGASIAAAGGTVSVLSDNFTLTAGGTITGAMFEFAPDSAGAGLTVGTGGQLTGLTGIGTSAIRLGEVANSVTASSIVLSSALDVSVGNGGAARPLDLQASGNITDGGVGGYALTNVTTLTGTSGSGSISFLNTSNTIGTLGNLTANAGSVLISGGPGMTVNAGAAVTAGATVSLSSTGLLTEAGSVGAPTVVLSGGSIALSGTINTGGSASGAVTLTASDPVGWIAGTGTLITGSLSGSSGGATTLTGGSNQIGTIASFTAAGFQLNDGAPLTVSGVLSGGSTIGITDSANAVTISGTASATAVSLSGSALTIPGLINTGGSQTGSVTLTATGAIGETGTVITGTLSGSSTGAATLTSGSNQIGTIASFTAAGFQLNDGAPLTVSGVLSGGPTIGITDSANAVTISGTASATAVSLSGSALTIPGLINTGGSQTGSVTLTATGAIGTIGETGTVITGTLSGSSTGAATLTSGTNQIGTIASFTAAGFQLNDGAPLTVSGVLSGGSTIGITDSANAVTISGTASATAVSLSGSALTIPGLINTGGSQTGSVTLTATGAIGETGTVITGTLSGSSTGAVTLTSGSNQIGTVASFSAAGFQLNDGAPLTVSGVLSGGSTIGITDSANAVTISGTASATAVSLSGSALTIPGLINTGGSQTGSVTLTATGAIGETGTVITGTLSGSSTGAVTLTSGSNQIGTVASFSAAGFQLNDGAPLTVSGVLSGGPTIGITDSANAVTISGTASATAVSLSGSALTIPGLINTGGSQTGSVTLTATGAIGTIGETGTVITGTLSGSSTGAATLTSGTNQIGTIASFTAAGFQLNDGAPLTVSGALSGGSTIGITDPANAVTISGTASATAVSLSGSALTIPGLINTGGSQTGSVTLTATGAIGETGTVITGTLSGSSTGAATLTSGSNQIGTVASFSAAGFQLNDGAPLTVSGVLSGGPTIGITDSANAVTISGTASATAVSLSGSALTIPGLINTGGSQTGSVTLTATGAIGTIGETGTVITGTLSGSSTGAATLTSGSNQIGTIASFTAAGFQLNDGAPLTVSGVLSGGSTIGITDPANAVTISGTASATAVSLSGSALTIPGLINTGGSQTGSVTLTATGAIGTIGETGTVITGTLSGSSTGAATLTSGSNQIGTIASFTAAGFQLNDGAPLTVSGALSGGPTIGITDPANAVTISGTASATAVSLSGSALTIPGLINTGGSQTGSVTLTATGAIGTIGETGTVITGTLSGSSTGAATLTSGTNQIGTVATFSAAGFQLNDGAPLTVSGILNGGPSVGVTSTASISVPGGVTATAVSLSGTSLTVGGTVSATTAALASGGGISITGSGLVDGTTSVGLTASTTISDGGTLIAGTLTGSAGGAAALTGATATTNQVGTIASFTAAGFQLNDGTPLTVSGVLSGGSTIGITAPGNAVTISGTASATAVSLSGSALTIPGLINTGGSGTGSVTLTASGAPGTIAETGTIITGTLSGSATGAAALTGASNQVGTIASFSAAGFQLNDDVAVTVSGLLSGGTSVAISAPGDAVTISGTASATAVSLNGSALTIPGLINTGGSGTGSVTLTASGTPGTIGETGTVITGTLSGSSTGAANLTSGTNQIGTIASFTAAGFQLNDGAPLTVSGVLTGGSTIGITDPANAVTISGTATAASVSLSGASLTIPGAINTGGGASGSVTLTASGTPGTIAETGTVITGTLSGSSTGAANLTSGTNQIGTVGSFTAAGFQLNDGIALAVTGSLSGGASIAVSDLSNPVTISGTAMAALVSLSGSGLSLPGLINTGGSGTGSVTLTASGTPGTIVETGTIVTGTLSGTSTGSTSLTGGTNTANQIGTIASFSAAGFTLNDGVALTVTGLLNGGSAIALLDPVSAVSINGTATASSVGVTATAISIPGTVSTGGGTSGSVSLTASGGPGTGTIAAPGQIITGTLTGTAGDAITLSNTANAIGILNGLNGGAITLVDSAPLSIVSPVTSTAGIAITDTGMLTVSAPITATGTVSLADTGVLTLSSPISGSGIGITDTGGVTATAAITASGTAGVSLSASGPISIASTAPISAPAGGITVKGTGTATFADTMTAATTIAVLSSGSLSVTGTVTGGTGVSLQTGGGNESLSAIIMAGSTTLAGSIVSIGSVTIGGTVNAGGNTAPAQLSLSTSNTITATGGIAINDENNTINLTGVLNAPRIVIDNGQSGALTIGTGTAIETQGTVRPAGQLSLTQLPAAGDLGAFITTGQFALATGLTVSGAPSVLRIDAYSSVKLGTVGLVAPNTWLISYLHNGSSMTGALQVKAFDLVFNGTGGSATLTGSVDGFTGVAAATDSHIEPNSETVFRVNSCPINSVNCVLLPTQGIPTASPLREVILGAIFTQTDEDDLLLPLVSDEVY